jgi:hypothetical protein
VRGTAPPLQTSSVARRDRSAYRCFLQTREGDLLETVSLSIIDLPLNNGVPLVEILVHNIHLVINTLQHIQRQGQNRLPESGILP